MVDTEEIRDILPDDVQPEHYSLSLSTLCIEAPWTYQGQVDILLRVKRTTQVIVLNSHELTIHRAQISLKTGAKFDAIVHGSSQISYDATLQRCSIHFGPSLKPSDHETVLSVEFEGCMNDYMAGFYRSEYDTEDTEEAYMFSTQFEPSEARRAFPCFDEPALKATFDLQLEIPLNMTALSNTPVKKSIKLPKTTARRKIVAFERTSRMSTYLLAWAIGPFEYIERNIVRRHSHKPLPIRVYTTEGLRDQGKRGLQVTCDVIDYFSEMFGIDYPLPKLDLIAVHEMSDDAMENWGLVTFEPTALLFDEEESDPSYLVHMTYIVAHELAHQWFGNLTTMEWWDELWLNEGFATWAGWCACDHLHPEWEVWTTFAAEDMRTAFDLDGLRSSHPIQVPILDGREVDSIFDSISYLKSATVIRMLAARLGLPAFLKGVSDYLKANAYGNATADALWEALEKGSGQKVTSVMNAWVKEVGFPVLTVTNIAENQIHIRQDRFLLSGRPSPDESATIWHVPIQVPTLTGTRRIDLTTRETTIQDIDPSDFYRLNAGQMGFFLTQVSAKELGRLCAKIEHASTEDQVGLLTDVSTLAMSEDSTFTTADVLTVVSSLGSSKPVYPVITTVLSCLDGMQSIFSDDEDIDEALDKLAVDFTGDLAQDLGWTVHYQDYLLTIQLRALVLTVAGLSGHKWTIQEALKLWDDYREDEDTDLIHQSLRSTVFSIAIHHRGQEAFEILKELYEDCDAPDTGEIIVDAMSEVATSELATKCLTFALHGGMSSSDTSDLFIGLAQNSIARDAVWTFMQENWALIDERLGGSSAVMEPLIRHTMQVFATEERKKEIEEFFVGKNTTGYTRGLRIALEWISVRAKYQERDGEVVRGWLREKGYL